MPNHTYRVTEIVGTSPDSVDQAIRNGVARASQTLRNLDWFEVTQVRGPDRERRHRALAGGPEGRLPARRVGLTAGLAGPGPWRARRPAAPQVRPSPSCACRSAPEGAVQRARRR